jgi:hypothetical protein
MAHTVEVPEYAVQYGVRVDPSRTALIIGDMQNDFVKEGGTLVVPAAQETIPAIRNLLDLARESGMRVVFVQDTHRDGDPEWRVWGEHCREGSWGWQVVDELAPREDEATVRKPRYDAFYATELEHMLRVGYGYAHYLWHGRQHLRPLHGVQCRHEMVSGRSSQRLHLKLQRLRHGGISEPDGLSARRGCEQRRYWDREARERGTLPEQAGGGGFSRKEQGLETALRRLVSERGR